MPCKHPNPVIATHRQHDKRIRYFRCTKCGAEWTQELADIDLNEPVSSAEVLRVHERLEQDLTIEQLLTED